MTYSPQGFWTGWAGPFDSRVVALDFGKMAGHPDGAVYYANEAGAVVPDHNVPLPVPTDWLCDKCRMLWRTDRCERETLRSALTAMTGKDLKDACRDLRWLAERMMSRCCRGADENVRMSAVMATFHQTADRLIAAGYVDPRR